MRSIPAAIALLLAVSKFFDRDMEVSIMFRDPSQQNFHDSRYNVFHIYKPNTQLASL